MDNKTNPAKGACVQNITAAVAAVHAASPAHANRTAAEIADLANNNNEMK